MLGKTNGGGGGFDPSEIQSGTIAVDNILGLDSLGDIVKGNLAGQYVRVIPAPASTTLTDELIEVFKEGVFVNGAFLGMVNPVFFPCKSYASNYFGLYIGADSDGTKTRIGIYKITTSTNKIADISYSISISHTTGIPDFAEGAKILGKSWPSYPTTNTTPKVLQIASNGGSLSWGDIPSPAVVAYEGTSLLPTDVVFEDWTLHRAIKDGNVLWVVLTGKISNQGISSATIDKLFSITLADEIASKIYTTDGLTVLVNDATKDVITYWRGAKAGSTGTFALTSRGAKNLTLEIGSFGLSEGSSVFLDVRIPIFLDIGTVS